MADSIEGVIRVIIQSEYAPCLISFGRVDDIPLKPAFIDNDLPFASDLSSELILYYAVAESIKDFGLPPDVGKINLEFVGVSSGGLAEESMKEIHDKLGDGNENQNVFLNGFATIIRSSKAKLNAYLPK